MSIKLAAPILLLVASSSCVVQTVPEQGATGPAGKDADESEIEELRARVEALEKTIGAADPECPPGYEREGVANPNNPSSVACVLGSEDDPADRIVKVGHGASAFWIDAYEATLWDGPNVDAIQLTGGRADGLQVTWSVGSAQYVYSPIYAWSRATRVLPPAGVTWFLANTACAQSGKRLPTRSEWLIAAAGTLDPPDPSLGPGCLTSNATSARKTGEGANCRSYWGAEDMVGNVCEWTMEWYASPSQSTGAIVAPWPASFAGNGDQTAGIVSDATSAPGSPGAVGVPAAALHGGNFVGALNAGIFALDIAQAPSYSDGTIGFRCVIPQ